MLIFKIYLGVGAIVAYFLTKPKVKTSDKLALLIGYLITVVLWLPMIILGVVVALKGSKKADEQMDEIDINDLCDALDGSYYFTKEETEEGETYKQKSETCISCNNDNPNELTNYTESKPYVFEDVEEGKEDEETLIATIEYKLCSLCVLKGLTGLEYIKEYVERHKPRVEETEDEK
ncbi:hypothetical protein P9X10_00985 [Bacillus cereus]|nr:hypothetical protein [Bacillus cereus]